MHFLERKLEDLPKRIAGFCDQKDPVIFLFDNINLYKGQQTHTRITNAKQVPLWNFTVRGVIKPNLKDFETLLSSTRSCYEPQRQVNDLQSEDVLLGKYQFKNLLTLQIELKYTGNHKLPCTTYTYGPVPLVSLKQGLTLSHLGDLIHSQPGGRIPPPPPP